MRHHGVLTALLAMSLAIATAATMKASTASAVLSDCASFDSDAHLSINPATNAMLITPWSAESSTASKRYGFTLRLGTPFKVSAHPDSRLVGIVRAYQPRTHDFLYISNSKELTAARRHGYEIDGTRFYASRSDSNCLKPISRYTKDGITRYASSAVQTATLKADGWTYRGIAFYAAPSSSPIDTTSDRFTAGPLSLPMYVSKATQAWNAYESATSPHTKSLLYQIAGTPTAIWLGGSGGDEAKVGRIISASSAAGQTPQFVLYAIPHRDCGRAWSGGLSGPAAYYHWIDSIRDGIGHRPAIVIVEPDAIGLSCLSPHEQQERISMLRYAMKTLSSDRNTWLYIHGGSSGLEPSAVGPQLKEVGVGFGRGFALNISGFDSTVNEERYGDAVLSQLASLGIHGKHYVIDTSRNGLGRPGPGSTGSASPSCNPPGRALGTRPTTNTGNSHVDAWLWVKPPGESDGKCHPSDPLGWFQGYALDITQRAVNDKIISWMEP